MHPNDLVFAAAAGLAIALFLRAPKDNGSKVAAGIVLLAIGAAVARQHAPVIREHADPWYLIVTAIAALVGAYLVAVRHLDRWLAVILAILVGGMAVPLLVGLFA